MSNDVAAIVERARLAAQQPAADQPAGADRARLKHIAAEFESMLLVQVLKDMRRAGSWEEEGGGDTLGAESLFETLDVELASHLAKVKGMGLGRQLEEAFDRMQPSGTTVAPVGNIVEAGLQPGPARPEGRPLPSVSVPVAAAPRSPQKVAAATRTAAQAMHDDKPAPDVVTVVKAAVPAAVAHLLKPVAGAVTSAFGWRRHPITHEMKFHQGVDLRASYGQDVQAAAEGKVVFSGDQGAYGTTVVVQHQDGTRTRYAHLSARLVKQGDQVAAGEPLGRAGRSGRATGTHLHFEVIAADGRRIQPEQWNGGQHAPVAATAGAHEHNRPAVGNPPVMTVARSIKDRPADAD